MASPILIRGLLFALVLASGLFAQKRIGSEIESRLPVKVIDDRLVVRCEVATQFRTLPVNLIVDTTNPCALALHNQAAKGLRAERPDGSTFPITIRLPGFDIQVPRRDHGDEKFLNNFTKMNSPALGEVACVGFLGAGILGDYHVTLDLPGGFIVLEPKRARRPGLPSAQAGSRACAITLKNDQVWLPITLANGERKAISVSTQRIDSLVDSDLSEDLGALDGAVGKVDLLGWDLAQHVAFRPEVLTLVHPDGAFGTLGLNVLQDFVIEIDRVNRWARITPKRDPKFPVADLAFFAARATEESAPLVAFLEKYPECRLAHEGAEVLLELLLEQEATAEEIKLALNWLDRTTPEELRATSAFELMKSLLELNRADVAIIAGEFGIKAGRKDRYPEAVHKIHAKVGELCLADGRDEKAWEHLLSAAFGLPNDGRINYDLGRFYERGKRYRRAMSRYIQAVITPEAGELAVKGLERVQAALGGESLSVDTVDRLISGKVHNFTAATKFKVEPMTDGNRVRVVELFTNAHFGRKQGEAWESFAIGGAMAVEGLLSHFPRERAIVLTHHLPNPQPDALMTEVGLYHAQRYGVGRPTVTIHNGLEQGPGAERWRNGEAVYENNRDMVLAQRGDISDYEIEIEANLKEGRLTGKVEVEGPDANGLQLQVLLVERGVLYPGKALVVVNRMVVRGVLAGGLKGETLDMADEGSTLAFDRSLSDVSAENRRFLEAREKAGAPSATRMSLDIDPRQVAVVALLRAKSSFEILQAAYLEVSETTTKPRKEKR